MKNSTVRAIICAALGNIIWGFSFLLTKVGLAVAPDPSVMLSHRYFVGVQSGIIWRTVYPLLYRGGRCVFARAYEPAAAAGCRADPDRHPPGIQTK